MDRGICVGLIVNPVAGMGGSVGLKGTDGVVEDARARGALPRSEPRAERALRMLLSRQPNITVVTGAGVLGENVARRLGAGTDIVYDAPAVTTSEDTRRLATELARQRVPLTLFSGGDGTAGDICSAAGNDLVVLGIPAGVKMHSGVFASNPEAAGTLAATYLQNLGQTERRPVMDIDEVLMRTGTLAPRLLGDMRVPRSPRLQHPKQRGQSDESARQAAAEGVHATLPAGALIAVGPGTTAGAYMERFGLAHTLLGFDLVRDGRLVERDVGEEALVRHFKDLHAVIAPIGGQGSLLGRGNQQLTPAVLRSLPRDRLHVVSTRERLASLGGRPHLIDIDDAQLARDLSGIYRIIVGPRHTVAYPATANT